MVTEKKVITSGAVLLLLIGAILLSNLLSNNRDAKVHGKIFESLDLSNISKVEVSENGNGVIIKKVDGKWRIGSSLDSAVDFRVDTIKVNALLDKFTIMSKEIILSSNGKSDSTYEVTADKGIVVKAISESGDTLVSFIIGKKQKNWRNSAVKVDGDNNIYSVSGSIRFAFKSKLDDWRDRIIFTIPQGEIATVDGVDSTGTIYNLSRESGSWKMTSPKEMDLDSGKVAKYLKSLESLKTTAWFNGKESEIMGFDSAYSTVNITLAGGDKFTVTVGNREGELTRRYVKSSTSDEIYTYYGSDIDRLFPFLSHFETAEGLPSGLDVKPAELKGEIAK